MTIFHGHDGYRRELVPAPRTEWYVGLDLGKNNDSSALAAIEKRTMRGEPTTYACRYLRTWLGVDWTLQVEQIAALLARAPLDQARKVGVDAVGVGGPVLDMLRRSAPRASISAISVHGGNEATASGGGWSVPKRDIVALAQLLLQQRRLRIDANLPAAEVLVKELQNFRVQISASGHDSYNAKSGAHDDLVSALCLGLWTAEKSLGTLEAW